MVSTVEILGPLFLNSFWEHLYSPLPEVKDEVTRNKFLFIGQLNSRNSELEPR